MACVIRAMKNSKGGGADAPASSSPTDTAPAEATAPGEASTDPSVASPGPEGAGDTNAPAHGVAEDVAEQPEGDAVTVVDPMKAATAGDSDSPATDDGSRAVVNPELSAAARDELQRLLGGEFERDVADPYNANGHVVLRVAPGRSIWRGGRHFTAGIAEVLACREVTPEQLALILGEPAFTCTFERAE